MKPANFIHLLALMLATQMLAGCGGTDASSSTSSSGSSSSASSSSSSTSSSSSSGVPVEPIPANKFVGNTTTEGFVRADFIGYWDQITPDYTGRWRDVERIRNTYDWTPVDRVYDYARQHNIPVKAVGLLWGSQTPAWITGLSAENQRVEVEEWIRDYCARYPDTAMIEVVKEAHPGHVPPSFARQAFGDDWITEVFKLARQYCPDSVLIYDDYYFLTWDTNAIIDLIRPAINAGVVDGLGLQAHGLYSPKVWSAEEIQEKLDLIASLGPKVYISEYDIDVSDDQQQLQYMQMHFPIFYDHPRVAGITLWGYIHGATWQANTGLIRDGQPRPAMSWLMDYLGR